MTFRDFSAPIDSTAESRALLALRAAGFMAGGVVVVVVSGTVAGLSERLVQGSGQAVSTFVIGAYAASVLVNFSVAALTERPSGPGRLDDFALELMVPDERENLGDPRELGVDPVGVRSLAEGLRGKGMARIELRVGASWAYSDVSSVALEFTDQYLLRLKPHPQDVHAATFNKGLALELGTNMLSLAMLEHGRLISGRIFRTDGSERSARVELRIVPVGPRQSTMPLPIQ